MVEIPSNVGQEIDLLPQSDAYHTADAFYDEYGPQAVTSMDKDTQQRLFDAHVRSYLRGVEVERKRGGIDPLGIAGRRVTCHELFSKANDFIRANETSERDEPDSRAGFFTVSMIDVNNLKDMNDIFTHPMGDHLLRVLVSYIKNSFRSTDTFGRVGGDEFVMAFLSRSDNQNDFRVEDVQKLLSAKLLQAVADGREIIQKGIFEIWDNPNEATKAVLEHNVKKKRETYRDYDVKKAINLIGTVAVGIHSYTPEEVELALKRAKINAEEKFMLSRLNPNRGEFQEKVQDELYKLLIKLPDEYMTSAKHTCKERLGSFVSNGKQTDNLETLKQVTKIQTGILRENRRHDDPRD